GPLDEPDRPQHEPRAQSDPGPQTVIEVGLLQRDLPTRLPSLDLRVLDFELGAERQSIIEAVREVDDETGKVDDGGSLGTGGVGVVHLAIAPYGGAFLGGEDLEGTGRHDSKEAPPDDRPHHDSVVMLVENGYQPEIPESKIRDSDGQAAIILVRTMSLILVALVLLLAGGLGWGALHLKRRLERSERDRRRGLAGGATAPTDPGLVVRSLSRARLELVRSSSGEPTRLLGDVAVDSAAAVSLRAHGVVVGTLVIANPRDRTFPPEDMRLLSTVATHAAIVIANARFFQRSEERRVGKECRS